MNKLKKIIIFVIIVVTSYTIGNTLIYNDYKVKKHSMMNKTTQEKPENILYQYQSKDGAINIKIHGFN